MEKHYIIKKNDNQILEYSIVDIISHTAIHHLQFEEADDFVIPIINAYNYNRIDKGYCLNLLKPCFQIMSCDNYKDTYLGYQFDNILLINKKFGYGYVLECVMHYITTQNIPEYADNINDSILLKKFILICSDIKNHLSKFKKNFVQSADIDYTLPIKIDYEVSMIGNCDINEKNFNLSRLDLDTMIFENIRNLRISNLDNYTKYQQIKFELCQYVFRPKLLERYLFLPKLGNYYHKNTYIAYEIDANYQFKITKGYNTIMPEKIIVPKKTNLLDISALVLGITGQRDHWIIPFEVILKKSRVDYDESYTHIMIDKSVLSGYCYSLSKNINNFYGFASSCMSHHDIYVKLRSRNKFRYKLVLSYNLYNSDLIQGMQQHIYYQLIHIYQRFLFSQKEITFKMFHNNDYDGFYINILRRSYEKIKIKISVNDKILAKIDNTLLDKYAKNFIVYDNILSLSEYTSRHHDSLYESLGKYLPNEIISIIESYIAPKIYSLCYIPFQFFNLTFPDRYQWFYPMPNYLKKTIEHSDIKIIFNKKINGSLIITSFASILHSIQMASIQCPSHFIQNDRELGRFYD